MRRLSKYYQFLPFIANSCNKILRTICERHLTFEYWFVDGTVHFEDLLQRSRFFMTAFWKKMQSLLKNIQVFESKINTIGNDSFNISRFIFDKLFGTDTLKNSLFLSDQKKSSWHKGGHSHSGRQISTLCSYFVVWLGWDLCVNKGLPQTH